MNALAFDVTPTELRHGDGGARAVLRLVLVHCRLGDRRLRIRPAKKRKRRPLTAQHRPTWPGEAAWTKTITAFARWVDGRGALTFLSRNTKRFEPAPIPWSDLPVDVARALGGVCEALTLPRVIGAEHYPLDGGSSVEARLDTLLRVFAWWRQGSMPAADVIAVADGIAAFILAAPLPTRHPGEPENRYTAADMRQLAELVAERCKGAPWIREELEEATWRELQYGSFEPTATLEQRAKLAHWRAEYYRRERRRREVLVADVDGGAGIVDDEIRHPAENNRRRFRL